MSWPDGDPRFIVRENSGYAILDQGRQGYALRTEIMVMDRGYCHNVVWSSWNNPAVMHLALEKQRSHAHSVADRLEKEAAAA